MDIYLVQIGQATSQLLELKARFWKDLNDMDFENLKAKEEMKEIVEDISNKIDASIARISAI